MAMKSKEPLFASGDPFQSVEEHPEKKLVYCTYKSEGCQWTGELQKLEEHELSCPSKLVNCEFCKKFEATNKAMKQHIKSCSARSLPCPSGCGAKIMPKKMVTHVNNLCPLTIVNCEHCKDFRGPRNKFKKHEKSCPSLFEPCPNGCGAKILPNNIEEHTCNKCPLTIVNCEHCKDFQGPRNKLKKHEKSCPSLFEPCPNGCGAKILPNRIEEHTCNKCPLTIVNCEYCKDFQGPRNQLKEHDKLLHLCPNGCGVKMRAKKIEMHIKNYCPLTVQAPRSKLNKHEKSCPSSSQPCPNGCGAMVHVSEIQAHIDRICSLTIVSCEFAYAGCKVVKHRRDMKRHIEEAKDEHLGWMSDNIKKLEKENAKLRSDYKNLVLSVHRLEKEIANLELDNENLVSLCGDVGRLKVENDEVKSENAYLCGKVERLEEEIEKLKSDNADKDKVLKLLRKRLEKNSRLEGDFSAQILASNFPPRTNIELIRSIFSQFGKVKDVRPFFKNDAVFIEFEDSTSRSKAVNKHLKSGIRIHGTLLKIYIYQSMGVYYWS